MLEIFKKIASKAGNILYPAVEKKALAYFELKSKEKGFGNARGVRNTFEDLIYRCDNNLNQVLMKEDENEILKMEDNNIVNDKVDSRCCLM